MNIKQFNELQQLHGTNLVWCGEDSFCFMIGNVDIDDEYERLESQLSGPWNSQLVEGIDWGIAMGDDIVHCVSVTDLANFDKIEGLEEWVVNNIGSNSYTIN